VNRDVFMTSLFAIQAVIMFRRIAAKSATKNPVITAFAMVYSTI